MESSSPSAVAWRRLLIVLALGLLAAGLAAAYLRARYSRQDLFTLLWGLTERLSHGRFVLGLLASGALVWLVARWLGEARMAYPALSAYLAGVLADAFVLFLSEPLGVSYGPLLLPLTLVAMARCACAVGLSFLAWVVGRAAHAVACWPLLHVAGQALILALVIDGLAIEPVHLTVSHVSVADPYRAGGRPFRIVQISDLHIERANILSRRIVGAVNRLQPDLIVLTGDYLNTSYLNDPQAIADCRRLIGALRAGQGIYAIRGNTDSGDLFDRLFSDLPVTTLEDRWVAVEIGGREIVIAGVAWHGELGRDRRALDQLQLSRPPGRFSLLLFHSPDLAPEAVAAGFNLYPAGHSHGGQIRLPLYGALATVSLYGKRYEMGPYLLGGTLLYVSRGVGMEGWLVPRMRFLCPPEVVCYDVS